MSKLEELVPPLELCKMIPKEEFGSSIFIWHFDDTHKLCMLKPFDQYSHGEYKYFPGEYRCPAPTLEELIKELPLDTIFGKEQHGEIWLSHNHTYGFQERNGATAALKLWLELKGIDYE
jgi:hypothetical protein